MPKSKINTSLLTQYSENNSDRPFSLSDLESLFVGKAQELNSPPSITLQTFVQMLLRHTKLRAPRLPSPSYSLPLRYGWGGEYLPHFNRPQEHHLVQRFTENLSLASGQSRPIGRSNPDPTLRKSAGARLIVTHCPYGNANPQFRSANFTR